MKQIVRICISFCFILISISLLAEEYPISSIPDDLKKEASAVIRYEENQFRQIDLNNAIEKRTKVITIFREGGRGLANIVVPQSRFHELKSFSGEIYLESGKLFKKIGKKDLINTAYSEHLASDDYYSFYFPSVPSYPYTVKYTYEVKWKNGLAYYPSFDPVPDFFCAVEKSVLRMQIPMEMSVRFKENELATAPTRQLIEKDSVYTFVCEHIPATAREPMCPPIRELTPFVLAAPLNFCFDKVTGNMSTWQGVGLFLSKLQEGRMVLSPETTANLQRMVATATDDREKVQILYDYLQQKTRYVSIQLGIGGWQPLPAEQVDKTGFGDCKALSNYMKTILEAVGIRSEYAIVHTQKKRMFPEFSTPTQANHAILMVPLAQDSIWLECTSRDLPGGYLHTGIAGHDVLLVSNEKSDLCKVGQIPDSLHTTTNVISMVLQPDGTAISSIKSRYNNNQIEGRLGFVLYKSENERMTDLAKDLSFNKTQIDNIQTNYQRSSNPEVTISYDLQAEKHANITGSRMFVTLNPFRNQWSRSFSASSRTLPIHLPSVALQTDSILLEIPKGYVIESCPKPLSLQTEFGTFSSSIEEIGNQLIVVQQMHVPTGKYDANLYAEMKEFFRQIDTCLAGRVVLRKEE